MNKYHEHKLTAHTMRKASQYGGPTNVQTLGAAIDSVRRNSVNTALATACVIDAGFDRTGLMPFDAYDANGVPLQVDFFMSANDRH